MKKIDLVTFADLEEMTGLSNIVIRNMVADNNIPCIKAGNIWYINLGVFMNSICSQDTVCGVNKLKEEVLKRRERNKQYIGTERYKGKTRDDLKTEEQKAKAKRDRLEHKRDKQKLYGVMVWCSESAKQLPAHQYINERDKAYKRQQYRAFTGTEPKNKETDFIYDFDLERMYQDGFTFHGKKITKWWSGEIKHWTVNDGVFQLRNS